MDRADVRTWHETLGRRLVESPASSPLARLDHRAEISGSGRVRLSETPGIPKLRQFVPNKQLSAQHFLKDYIEKSGPLNSVDLQKIFDDPRIDLSIIGFESGALAAASNSATNYSTHAWTRDMVILACALRRAGLFGRASSTIESLTAYYGGHSQYARITSFHFDRDPVGRYMRNEQVPHVRMRISDDGSLTESKRPWHHNQLDAMGMWLWGTFRFANDNVLNLQDLNDKISKQNPLNGTESIVVATVKFLNRIKFWQQSDVGPWEFSTDPQRATSIGICVAALSEALQYFRANGWDSLPISYGDKDGTKHFRNELESALAKGKEALLKRIPDEPDAVAVETERFASDAALLFLLYPFTTDLSEHQEHAILRSVRPLIGKMGLKRNLGDRYVAEDYIYNKDPGDQGLFSHHSWPTCKEAEWPMFVSLLQGYFSRRYVESKGTDRESFVIADQLLKWSLALINSDEDKFTIDATQTKVEIPSGTFPEGYWFDSKSQLWRPNHNSPLAMSKAAFAMAAKRHEEAVVLWEGSI